MHEHDKIAQRLGMLLTRLYSGEKLHLSDLATEYNVTVRTTRGEDIDAACGQLVGQVLDRTRRSERYIAVRELSADSDLAQNAANTN